MTNYKKLQDKIALLGFLENTVQCVDCPMREECYTDDSIYSGMDCIDVLSAWLDREAK